jgi:hypothetical protein
VLAPPVGGGVVRRYLPLASLVTGTTLGGLLMGGGLVLAWFALEPSDAVRTAIVLGVGGVCAAAVLIPSLRRWLPEAACQVPSKRMAEDIHSAAFRWGVELGTGVSTFVVTPALYALLAVALVQHGPILVAAVLGVYGCTRGAAIASFAVVYARRTEYDAVLPGIGLERAMRVPLVLSIVAATAFGIA